MGRPSCLKSGIVTIKDRIDSTMRRYLLFSERLATWVVVVLAITVGVLRIARALHPGALVDPHLMCLAALVILGSLQILNYNGHGEARLRPTLARTPSALLFISLLVATNIR
jgi:hypothetical protein